MTTVGYGGRDSDGTSYFVTSEPGYVRIGIEAWDLDDDHAVVCLDPGVALCLAERIAAAAFALDGRVPVAPPTPA